MSAPPPTTIPPALRAGDTIAFLSPSARLNEIFPLRIARAKNALVAAGYRVKEIYTPAPSGHLAAIKHRAAEVHSAFTDPEVHAIVCTIGGLSADSLLPHLDYPLIGSHPKIFVGYSDITLLHHALLTLSSLRTFYGPAAITQLAEIPRPLAFTWSHFVHMLQDSVDAAPGAVPRSGEWTQHFADWMGESAVGGEGLEARPMGPVTRGWKWLYGGAARGRLLGGCLPSLVQLTGTPYVLPPEQWAGRILLLEIPEGGEGPAAKFPLEVARSNLVDLRNAGVLGKVGGVVVGRPFQYDDGEWERWEEMLKEELEGLGPVLVNVDVGHTDPILTLPLDGEVVLDAGRDLFEVVEVVVRGREGGGGQRFTR